MVYTKNSLNFFYVTSLHFLGQSVIEKAGITKSVRKIRIKTLKYCWKMEFSRVCYKCKPSD